MNGLRRRSRGIQDGPDNILRTVFDLVKDVSDIDAENPHELEENAAEEVQGDNGAGPAIRNIACHKVGNDFPDDIDKGKNGDEEAQTDCEQKRFIRLGGDHLDRQVDFPSEIV